MRKHSYLLVLVAMLAFTASRASAQQCHEEPQKKTAKKSDAANQGVVVAVDPETKELRPPTAEEMEQLNKSRPAPAAAAARSGQAAKAGGGVREIHHHSGAEGLTLDDSFMTSMTATVSKDGKVKYDCVDGKKAGAKSTATKKGGADVR